MAHQRFFYPRAGFSLGLRSFLGLSPYSALVCNTILPLTRPPLILALWLHLSNVAHKSSLGLLKVNPHHHHRGVCSLITQFDDYKRFFYCKFTHVSFTRPSTVLSDTFVIDVERICLYILYISKWHAFRNKVSTTLCEHLVISRPSFFPYRGIISRCDDGVVGVQLYLSVFKILMSIFTHT